MCASYTSFSITRLPLIEINFIVTHDSARVTPGHTSGFPVDILMSHSRNIVATPIISASAKLARSLIVRDGKSSDVIVVQCIPYAELVSVCGNMFDSDHQAP